MKICTKFHLPTRVPKLRSRPTTLITKSFATGYKITEAKVWTLI